MNFKSGFFVIGTDTDVGKTYISSLLYKAFKEDKKEIAYYKPIQSGCFMRNSELIAPDIDFLCNFNKIPYDDSMLSYKLTAAVSPHLASEIDSIEIDELKISKKIEDLKNKNEHLIIEGAGGLLVPLIRDKFYIYDLINISSLPVILVCGTYVGSINHSLLTINALKQLNIPIAGIIFNRAKLDKETSQYELDNIDIVTKLSNIENYLTIKEGEEEIKIEDFKKFIRGESIE